MKKLYLAVVLALNFGFDVSAAPLRINSEAKSFKYSKTVEKERPKLDEVTRQLIANYRKNPTEANKLALRKQIAINYDAVLMRKKAKLEELKRTAREQKKVDEMQEIVNEMLMDRERRIDASLARFTDARLKPGVRENKDGYLPVLGAAQNVSIAYAVVTNADSEKFIRATGRKAPKEWVNGTFPVGKGNYPVVNVSYYDAAAYCEWLSGNDRMASYRLPTEKEWEQAAGHMPKDADFNAEENAGLTSAFAFADTLSAAGAVNMWGNVWEWTSTAREGQNKAVKGGSWDAKRADCRTEYRGEGRNPNMGYGNVGFRIIREK